MLVYSRAMQPRRDRVTKTVPSAGGDAEFLGSRSDVAPESVAWIQGCTHSRTENSIPFSRFSIRSIRMGSMGRYLGSMR